MEQEAFERSKGGMAFRIAEVLSFSGISSAFRDTGGQQMLKPLLRTAE